MICTITSGSRERRAGDARVAVAERPHRVEQVRDRADAAVEGGVRLLGGRVGVADGDGDPARVQQVDQLAGARQLGRERDEPHRPGGEDPLEQRRVGVAAGRRRVRAEAVRREERALDVRAEDPRPAVGVGRHLARARRPAPPRER